jgi:hypothetical protein
MYVAMRSGRYFCWISIKNRTGASSLGELPNIKFMATTSGGSRAMCRQTAGHRDMAKQMGECLQFFAVHEPKSGLHSDIPIKLLDIRI